MKSIFQKYGIPLNQNQEKKFEQFLALFTLKNKVINLSSIRDETEIIEKHFIDSLMITKFVDIKGIVGDLGSGGGFPGIPLALYLSDQVQIDCIDSTRKKVTAIEEFARSLEMMNVIGVWGRAEELAGKKEYFEKYDILVSRAVAYFPILLGYTLPLVKSGGLFIAYKGENSDEMKEGEIVLKQFGAKVERVEHYEIDGQKRSFIFVRKG